MLPLIEAKKAELAALCRKHHVRRLDVFGSAARGADFEMPDTKAKVPCKEYWNEKQKIMRYCVRWALGSH
jgi:hypothetical protein